MTIQEIEETLHNLKYTIDYQRHKTMDDYKVRVRMGREFVAWVRCYSRYLIADYKEPTNLFIFGCPVEIDLENPMCLEVLLVEEVNVCRHEKAATSK